LSTANPPAGYYADPSVPGYIRYWDGTEWVAGSSRPAPTELAEQGPASPQGNDAAAKRGGRHAAVQNAAAWQPEPATAVRPPQSQSRQHAPSPRPMPFAPPAAAPAPTPKPVPTPSPAPMPFAQPTSAPPPTLLTQQRESESAPPSVADDETEGSLTTMIVPSAFAHGARPGNSYAYPGQSSNPFAGLPDVEFTAPDEVVMSETIVVELATPGSRILARIIDLGIAVVFSAPITTTLLLIAHHHDHQYVLKLDAEATTTYTTLGMDALGIALWAGALLTLMIVSIVYEGARLSQGGQTIGRRLAGVRVVRMPDGLPLGRDGIGTRRALLFWILAILPLLDILTLGGVFWGRPYRQGLHERATSTATVKI
jgi:hypothetical protein